MDNYDDLCRCYINGTNAKKVLTWESTNSRVIFFRRKKGYLYTLAVHHSPSVNAQKQLRSLQ